MKKISILLLSSVIILTACHNEGSSTVAEDANESSSTIQHSSEQENTIKSEETHDSTTEKMDTAKAGGTENLSKKDTGRMSQDSTHH